MFHLLLYVVFYLTTLVGLFQVLPRLILVLAILIPVISGQFFLRPSDDGSPVDLSGAAIADFDSEVDIEVTTKPCCILSGNSKLFVYIKSFFSLSKGYLLDLYY